MYSLILKTENFYEEIWHTGGTASSYFHLVLVMNSEDDQIVPYQTSQERDTEDVQELPAWNDHDACRRYKRRLTNVLHKKLATFYESKYIDS